MTNFIEENNPFLALSESPLVAILMGTKNGALFLAEQLDSLETQIHQNWVAIISDDGSTDQTLEILQQYQSKWVSGKLTIRSGPRKGFCQNFLSLACDPNIRADYYAFCDQDDVWLPNKLIRGIQVMQSHPNDVARLYCGRTTYISEDGKVIGQSPRFVHPKTFRNALVQCIAGGNTMLFNKKSKMLLEMAGSMSLPSHDWWLYQLLTGHGGVIHFDLTPLVKYRQHPNSLVGQNKSLASKLERLTMVLNNKFKKLIDQNIQAIEKNENLITEENLEVFNLFKELRNRSLKDRFRLIQVCGIYRQSWQGTISLMVAAILKKI
jgi:glycosyltransferase involved in cell wall biosynthesis